MRALRPGLIVVQPPALPWLPADQQWRELDAPTRRKLGDQWYRARNRRDRRPGVIPRWAPEAAMVHRRRHELTMALVVAIQQGRSGEAGLLEQLTEARRDVEVLRSQAELGVELAEAVARQDELTRLLLRSRKLAEADTDLIPRQRAHDDRQQVAS